MAFLLLPAKIFSILVNDFFSFPFYLYGILFIILFGVLYFLKKNYFTLVFFALFFLFAFFDALIPPFQHEKLNSFVGEVIDIKPKEDKIVLGVKNDFYKIWATYKGQEVLEQGYWIEMTGAFYPIQEKNYFYSEGYTHTGWIKELKIQKAEKNKNFFIDAFESLAEKTDFPYLYRGFVLAERDYVPDFILDLFKTNGVMHLMATSGLHIGVIAIFVFFFLKFFPIPPKVAILIYLFVILGYLFLIDFPAAAVRAVSFALLLGIAKIIERRVSLIEMLFLGGFFILLFEPKMLYSPGLIISFLAAFGILFSMPLIKKVSEKMSRFVIIQYLMNALLVGIFVQLFILPVLFYFFKTVNFFSLILTIPLSLLLSLLLIWSLTGFFIGLIWEKLGLIFFSAGDLINFLMLKIMEMGASIDSLIVNFSLSGYGVLLYYILLIPCFLFLKKKWKLKEVLV